MIHKGTKTLASKRLILRKFKETDSNEIYNGFINQKGLLYYFNKKSRTLEEEIISLKGIDEKYQKNNYYNWLIVLKDTNAIIGTISLNVSEINEMVEFNYALDDRYKNNGIYD